MSFPYDAPTIATPATATSGNWTGTEPSGSAAGDLLIACLGYRSNAPFTLPAGWTICGTQQSSGNTTASSSASIASGLMAYIIRGASAPSYVFTRTGGDVAAGRILRYPGPWAASTLDAASSTTAAVASATLTTSAVTTTSSCDLLVAFAVGSHSSNSYSGMQATDPAIPSGAINTTIPPTGDWAERVDATTTTGADLSIAVFDAVKATAGNTGTFSVTAAASSRQVMIVGAFKNAGVDLTEERVAKAVGYAVVNTLPQILESSRVAAYATFDTLLREFQVSKTVAYSVIAPNNYLVSKFRPYALVAPSPDKLTISSLRAFAILSQSAPEVKVSTFRTFAVLKAVVVPEGGRRRVILMIS